MSSWFLAPSLRRQFGRRLISLGPGSAKAYSAKSNIKDPAALRLLTVCTGFFLLFLCPQQQQLPISATAYHLLFRFQQSTLSSTVRWHITSYSASTLPSLHRYFLRYFGTLEIHLPSAQS
ncbi:hypothetical protein BJX99DRAFT_235512 [Aspergillus californicus]